MENLWTVLGLTMLAGAAIPIGALVARLENIQPQWLELEFRHSVIAFGGGALLAAVALVLVPEGTKHLSVGWVAVWLPLGGLLFMGLDILLDKFNSPGAQLVAMLSDFIPEAAALGASFANGESAGMLLALLIGLQNLPEGFNAFRELQDGGKVSPNKILISFCLLALLGPLAGWMGMVWLADSDFIRASIMLIAAGGILFLIFQDIAPQAKLEKRWAPALSSVIGFQCGVVGQLLIS